MCILVVLKNRVDGWPLLVGANRDEYRDRPWELPRVEGSVLAPRDLRAGGTWIGVNRSGLLVAVTNRPDSDPDGPDPARPSRGLLALDLLGQPDDTSAIAWLSTALHATPRNPFRALLATANGTRLVTGAGGIETVDDVPDGLHTVTNLRGLDELDHGGALDRLDRPEGATLDETLARLRDRLALHDDRGPGGRDVICKHEKDRGTLSSTIVALPAVEEVPPVFLMAPGAPCETAWEDHGAELGPLGRRPT